MDVPFPLNTPLPFFGVDNNRFKIGDVVYEALEDPDDGYRSYLTSVAVRDGGIFFPNPVATVTITECSEPEPNNDSFAGYAIKGEDGHQWLKFGTDTSDNYYPCFVFRYTPKAQ